MPNHKHVQQSKHQRRSRRDKGASGSVAAAAAADTTSGAQRPQPEGQEDDSSGRCAQGAKAVAFPDPLDEDSIRDELEEPSEVDSFLLDDNEIESELSNPVDEDLEVQQPEGGAVARRHRLNAVEAEELSVEGDVEEEDSDEIEDDLDEDLDEEEEEACTTTGTSATSSTSHQRFLLADGGGRGVASTSSTSGRGGAAAGLVDPRLEYLESIGNIEEALVRHHLTGGGSSSDAATGTDIHSVDPETQARLEALLEAAGIGKLTGETKQLADPEVLKKLTSSVSCALDEAAAALTRMRTDPPGDGRSLVEACNEGDISKVRRLLNEGRVSVHDTTEEGESLLSLACSAGYFELAQVLLAMRANVEDRGMKGDCTPLMEAASAGHTDIVKLLLSHGADVNAQSSSGNTPLMHACAGGHEEIVQLLLDANANVEDHNENGHTPLMEAASAGHVGVARILLKAGAGINTHSNEFKESALTLACYKGHLEMVRFLLDAGADQEHKTDEMHTALMEASMDGHVEVAKLLLDSGAQVNMPADSFESPLTLAACGGHVELAMLLLERGANIEEVNDEGYTPLMEASREGHEEMVALLLGQGADINSQTEETQETALTLACCGGFLEVADFLIKAGANLELGASTPLMEAAQEGHLELTKYLLENGASVNAQSGTGDTALTYACENGHTDVADLLLKFGAVLEHESEGGRTPLMKAARAGHLCTVQFLIQKGADVNRNTQNNDHTPLSLACAGGHIAVVELLLQHGADPYHKLKDNSTMLIEAAKGGHTNVVSILIDYPNSLALANDAAAPAANGDGAPFDPASGVNNLQQSAIVQPAPEQAVQPLPQSPGVSQPPTKQSNLRKSQRASNSVIQQQQQQQQLQLQLQPPPPSTPPSKDGSTPGGNKSKNANCPGYQTLAARSAAAARSILCSDGVTPGGDASGYDYIEASGFVLEEKGLDAKSYIQSVLRRHEGSGSTREEQIIQKEQILAELQRVEKELKEKGPSAAAAAAASVKEQPSSPGGAKQSSGTAKGSPSEITESMVTLSLLDKEQSPTVTSSTQTGSALVVPQPALPQPTTSPPSVPLSSSSLRSNANLANIPPSERPKAKPSRKIVAGNNSQMNANAGSVSSPPAPHAPGNDVKANQSHAGPPASGPQQTMAKKYQLQAALQQHSQQLAQLQQLQQLNQQLQQQVLQQRQLKQQNQATLAALQQNAIANQQQLAALQQNVAQLQELEQHILQQQQQNPSSMGGVAVTSSGIDSLRHSAAAVGHPGQSGSSGAAPASKNVAQNPPINSQSGHAGTTVVASNQQHQQLQARVQQILHQKQQLQIQIKQFQLQVEQQLAYTQNATTATPEDGSNAADPSVVAADGCVPAPRSSNKRSKDSLDKGVMQPAPTSGASSRSNPSVAAANAAFELVQATQALQAVQALQLQQQQLTGSEMGNSAGIADMEPLTQDPSLMTSLEQASLAAAAVQNCSIPNIDNCQVLLNGYREDLQAQALATSLQSSGNAPVQLQYQGVVSGTTASELPPIEPASSQQIQRTNFAATAIGLDQLLQGNQFPFGQASVDDNGQINFAAAADLNGPYLQPLVGSAGPVVDGTSLFLPGPNQSGSTGPGADASDQLRQEGIAADGSALSDAMCKKSKTAGVGAGAFAGRKKQLNQPAQDSLDVDVSRLHVSTTGDLLSAAAVAAGVSPNNLNINKQFDQQFSNYAATNTVGMNTAGEFIEGVGSVGSIAAAAAVTNPAAAAAISVDLDSATESNHDTALTLACAGGHEDLVTLLLRRGSNLEHRDKKGFTPLILAATAGHEKVVQILLDNSADIEAQSERTKDTPLSLACSGGRFEVVEVLLKKHANKEHRNVSDYTPLSLAASGGYVNIIKLLLAHGAEINSRTGSKLGISPLMLAAMNGHTAAVKLLLDMGSDINAQIETNRNTALTLACFQGRHEVVSLLLDRKANVEHRAKTGLTPLMEAASGGFDDVGRVLLDKHADVNAPPVPSSRDTALTIAADKGHYRFVELLLTRGAQVDVRNKKGNSSLWLAANGGHLDVVQLLHHAGADIDSQDNRKVSCLMAAFRKGHSKVVKWMVKHVSQFPSDQEMTRYIATLSDKDVLKKCNTCMEIVRVAKDKQAAEAAKNANNLLEELDREKNIEESKKAAAARKREKKKRKKAEKKGTTGNAGHDENDDDAADDNQETTTEDEKEKTPEVTRPSHTAGTAANEGDSGVDVNSQGSTGSRDDAIHSEVSKQIGKRGAVKEEVQSAASATTEKKPSSKKNKQSKSNKARDGERNGRGVERDATPPPTAKQAAKDKEQKRIYDSEVSRVPDTHYHYQTHAPEPPPVPQQTSGRKEGKGRQRNRNADNANGQQSGKFSDSPRKSNKQSAGSSQSQAAKEDSGWKEVVRKSRKVIVQANAISRVIGRGGQNINAIRELSGAHIEVEKQSKGASVAQDRTILIKGSADATRQAFTWINGIITSPEKEIGEIIGKQYYVMVQKLAAQQSSGHSSIQNTIIVSNSSSTMNSNASGASTAAAGKSSASAASSKSGAASSQAKPAVAASTNKSQAAQGSKKTAEGTAVTPSKKNQGKSAASLTAVTPAFGPSTKTVAAKSLPGSNPVVSSSFAAVAGGSEGLGMISSGGPHPGTLTSARANRGKGGSSQNAHPGLSADSRPGSSNAASNSRFSADVSGQMKQKQQQHSPANYQGAFTLGDSQRRQQSPPMRNLVSSSVGSPAKQCVQKTEPEGGMDAAGSGFSPFKSFKSGWEVAVDGKSSPGTGFSQQEAASLAPGVVHPPTSSLHLTGLDSSNELASRAPGYRMSVTISPSSSSTSSGWSAQQQSSKGQLQHSAIPVATEVFTNQLQERCSSAPETPVNPVISPIGPPSQQQKQSIENGRPSPSTDRDPYSNSACYVTSSMGGAGIGQSAAGRSLTPKQDEYLSEFARNPSCSLVGTLGGTVNDLAMQSSVGATRCAPSMMRNPPTKTELELLNQATQIANRFPNDYMQPPPSHVNLKNSSFSANNFGGQVFPGGAPGSRYQNLRGDPLFKNGSSTKLNPNAPDFMRGQGLEHDFIRAPGGMGQPRASVAPPGVIGASQSSVSMTAPSSTSTMASVGDSKAFSANSNLRGYGQQSTAGPSLATFSNILNNQSINTFLNQQSQRNGPGGLTGTSDQHLPSIASFEGRTLKEINEILESSPANTYATGSISSTAASYQQPQDDSRQPKSRPIGSERHRQLPSVIGGPLGPAGIPGTMGKPRPPVGWGDSFFDGGADQMRMNSSGFHQGGFPAPMPPVGSQTYDHLNLDQSGACVGNGIGVGSMVGYPGGPAVQPVAHNDGFMLPVGNSHLGSIGKKIVPGFPGDGGNVRRNMNSAMGWNKKWTDEM